ncbi:MAG: multi-sensor hybrid histidine kinase [Rickettsiaceae bacterium]|jgi:two-component system CAI-1 autoinducer sensor kinase/phosphatase CqsS|nr:multi-sensor hybrid histidine kinase [Rickettsiaceae bacterium]
MALKNDSSPDSPWKILTIDNVSSFNQTIELLSKNLSFCDKNLLVLKASSLQEGKEILERHSDIAVILVDIMMESKKLGLNFVEFVRNKLKNQESRIILRTGYPDSLPEKEVVQNYEIDGYIPKEISSALQLEVTLVTAIRNYHQIITTKDNLRSLAGSIAHELRNPLNAINLAQTQIEESLLNADFDQRNSLLSLTSAISNSTTQANSIINTILGDLNEKPISPSDFSCLKAKESLEKIIAEYGYSSEEEKAQVKLDISEENDFIFKAIGERFTFVIYNLLKNSLYYLKEYPNSTITVGSDTKEIDGKQYNIIYIHDTGPGISSVNISKLFGDFYTAGKKGGTGLGLSFCKRNMKLFGGDIICESELGKWTRFSLLFPVLSEKEIEEAKAEASKKKILLVDDQEVNLMTLKLRIERVLPYISCDLAKGGQEAIDMAKQNKYHLILMDVQMPEIDGIEATKKIRIHDREIPIIALTSLNKKLFLEEAKESAYRKDFNYYLNKLSSNNLYRTVSKWMMDLEDDMSYMGTKEEYLEILKGKKLLLADDEKINRMITKRVLETAGMIVTEANDGKELLELYQNSLNKNGKSSFDAIITDINMQPHNGDEAAKEIRNIEAINKISHHDEMPIIAISGDGSRKDIHHFFECQMTDYFIKGTRTELLLKIIANYLSKKEIKLKGEENKIADANKNHDPSSNSNKSNHLNQEKIENFTKEEQVRLLNMFIKSSAENMSKIAASKNAGNLKRLLFYIHSIKGTAANIGAEKLFNHIKYIEPKIMEGKAPHNWIEELEGILFELQREIRNIVGALS